MRAKGSHTRAVYGQTKKSLNYYVSGNPALMQEHKQYLVVEAAKPELVDARPRHMTFSIFKDSGCRFGVSAFRTDPASRKNSDLASACFLRWQSLYTTL